MVGYTVVVVFIHLLFLFVPFLFFFFLFLLLFLLLFLFLLFFYLLLLLFLLLLFTYPFTFLFTFQMLQELMFLKMLASLFWPSSSLPSSSTTRPTYLIKRTSKNWSKKNSIVIKSHSRKTILDKFRIFFFKFSCFVRLAEGFQVKRNVDVEVGEITQYFPHFVWLLRDVSLITSEEEGGKEMDPTDYIKKKVRQCQENKAKLFD